MRYSCNDSLCAGRGLDIQVVQEQTWEAWLLAWGQKEQNRLGGIPGAPSVYLLGAPKGSTWHLGSDSPQMALFGSNNGKQLPLKPTCLYTHTILSLSLL